MKRRLVWITFGGLLAASLVIGFLQPPPLDVARKHCQEKGLSAEDVSLRGYRGSRPLLSGHETEEFQAGGVGGPRKIVVELYQPVYFFPWRVTDFREAPLP